MMNNNHSYIFIDIIIVLVCILGSNIVMHVHVSHQHQQAMYYNSEVNHEIASYNKMANRNDKKLASRIKYKVSPNQSAWDLYTINQNRLNSVAQKFFTIYYNYNSDKEAEQRPKEMRPYATRQCLLSNRLFGYSLSGDNNKVISTFSSDDNYIYQSKGHYIRAIADIVYHAKIKGLTPNEGEKWYLITYDKNKDKLTSVIPFYRNTNTQQNIDKIN